MKKQKQ